MGKGGDGSDLGPDRAAHGAAVIDDNARPEAKLAAAAVRRVDAPKSSASTERLTDTPALLRLGYTRRDLDRVVELAGGRFNHPNDVRRVLDSIGYLDDWRENYQIQSVRASLHSNRITCIDAAILSYGLLDLLPQVQRRLLAIHRRDQHGEECGHCVTLWWTESGRIGAFSKSSFVGLGHREATFKDEFAIAKSFAKAYIDMGITPLYFGVTRLEEIAHGVDWRFNAGNLNELSERLKERYEYAFELPS